MGANHVRVFNELRDVARVVVVDTSEKVLEGIRARGFEKTVLYSSLDEALARERVDGASVVTPTPSHYVVASKLASRGIPLLVEKPITNKLEDASKLVEQVRRKKIVFAVGHIERCNPGVQALKKHVTELGPLVHASAHRFGIPTKRDVGSSFIDQATHDIDVISFLSGKYPRAVSAVEKRFVDEKYDDCCVAIYEFDGLTATVEANRVTPIKTRELILCGLKGTAKLDYIAQDLSLMKATQETTRITSFDEIVFRVGRGTEIKPYFVKEEPLKIELENFLQCIAGKARPIASGEDGLRALAAVLAGGRAARSGRKQKIVC